MVQPADQLTFSTFDQRRASRLQSSWGNIGKIITAATCYMYVIIVTVLKTSSNHQTTEKRFLAVFHTDFLHSGSPSRSHCIREGPGNTGVGIDRDSWHFSTTLTTKTKITVSVTTLFFYIRTFFYKNIEVTSA